jgi:non-specific serine/threonine protein kinase
MKRLLAIDPTGRLRVTHAAADDAFAEDEIDDDLADAFAVSSAPGLVLLAQERHGQTRSRAVIFWRRFTTLFFHAVCQLGEGAVDQWATMAAPSDQELADLAADAPPMRGLEYLTADALRNLWHELAPFVAAEAASHKAGAAAYLRSINPLWHLLGRVTFHLAENKRDPDRPFAFLATFTHRLGRGAQLQHLPLGRALQTYAGAGDRAKLDALLAPVRRAAALSDLVRELLDTKSLFAPQAWTIRQAHRFLSQSPKIEEAGVVVRVPNWWSARHPPRPQVTVRLGGKPTSALGVDSLLEFKVDLALDGDTLTRAEREQILSSTESLALLRGKWVEVDREKLREALDHWKQVQADNPDGIDFLAGMRMLAGVQLDEEADEEPVRQWSQVVAGDWLRKTLDDVRNADQSQACQPGRDLQGILRPYQVQGVKWLWFMTELGLGACLADDMGLGKTIQLIDLLLQRRRQRKHKSQGPCLLVAPASLLGNWREELARFAPSLRVFFAHRSETDAAALAKVAADPAQELADFDLVVTTYGLARREKWLAEAPWSLAVLDEAQAIKNAASKQTRSIKSLKTTGRVVLTGTPVENHLGDLWSIFDFCCPGLLGSAAQFKRFVKRLGKDEQGQGALRQLVRPYILRRLKTDPAIAPDLPEKTELRTECGLTKQQAALYQQAVEELQDRLDQAEGIARRGMVLATLMQLKQICNHPSQFLRGNSFAPDASGKFDRLKLLCQPIAERQEKALVFTQFQSLTQPLADYLATVFGGEGLVLHGGTPVKKRQELVRTFQNDWRFPFFVISLKAGGSGLNLTAASHVIHFDRWWNPAVENQATDRAFRIGQRRNVLVHKFVCRGTVEERIDAMIRDKLALADQILNEAEETLLTEMGDDELLRFVALDLNRATAE